MFSKNRLILIVIILSQLTSLRAASQLSIVNCQLSILLTVGDYSFDAEDFEYVYQKNRMAGNQTLEECMALYIPYKLKIVAAKDAGLDTLPEIINEWMRYCHRLSEQPVSRKTADELMDGLLLYAITDSVVWSKAARDTDALIAFHKKSARRFRWEKRMDATIFYCSDENVAARIQKEVQNKNEGKGLLPDGLFTFFCDENGVSPCVDTVRLTLPAGADTLADRFKWKKGCSKILELNGKFVFLNVHSILRPARKTFEEARGQVIAEYQDELERKWVEQLKKKYPVTIDGNVWANLKKKYAD